MRYEQYRPCGIPTGKERKKNSHLLKYWPHCVSEVTKESVTSYYSKTTLSDKPFFEPFCEYMWMAIRAEQFYRAGGSRTLFCDSASLGEALFRSKDLVIESELVIKNHMSIFNEHTFSVSFPQNLRLQGKPLKPVLVFCSIEEDSSIILFMLRGQFMQMGAVSCDTSHQNFQEHLTERIQDALESNTGDCQYSEDEFITVKNSILLASKLIMYSLCLPTALKDGPPSSMNSAHKKYVPGNSKHLVLQHCDTKSVHRRKSHFRTLHHERYKRQPNGLPKVIFVSGSIVGRGKTAV